MADKFLVIECRSTGDRILATLGTLSGAIKEQRRRLALAGPSSQNCYQVAEKSQYNLVKKHYENSPRRVSKRT